MMIFQIHNVINKDKIIATQQTKIETYWQGVNSRENEIITLQEKLETLKEHIETREEQIQTLEQKIFTLQTEPADKVLIEKKERRLTLLSNGEVIKTYKIALGENPVGPKEKQGDNKTPEGTYIIDSRNSNSGYHLSLHISYPNETDREIKRRAGLAPGGNIMIHGTGDEYDWLGEFHHVLDWTDGCIAVPNGEIEEIWELVENGTPIEIRP